MNRQSGGGWKKVSRWLPGVVLSLAVAVVLFFVTDWQAFARAFQQVRIISLLGAVGLTLVFLLLRAAAWRELLDGKAGFWQAFRIVNEGYLLNNILIHRAGEFARAIFMGQASGLGFTRALSSILLERVFDLIFAAGIFLLCLPLVVGATWAKTAGVITLVLVLAGLAVLFLMGRYRTRVQTWLERLNIPGKLWNQMLKPQAGNLLEGLAVLNRPRRFFLGAGYILLSWLVAFVFHFVILREFVPDAPFWWAVFGDTSLAIGIALPSAPAALGVFEGAIVGAFALLGVQSSTSLAFAITMHALQFVTTAVLGLIGLAQDGRSLSQLGRLFERRHVEASG